MTESEHRDLFPALEEARRLSDFLCEGELNESTYSVKESPAIELDEFTLTPEEAEAAHKLQEDLIHRLRTLHHSQWPRPDTTPRTGADQLDPSDLSHLLLGTTAP